MGAVILLFSRLLRCCQGSGRRCGGTVCGGKLPTCRRKTASWQLATTNCTTTASDQVLASFRRNQLQANQPVAAADVEQAVREDGRRPAWVALHIFHHRHLLVLLRVDLQQP